ncbi:MAG: carboxypeptidase regulatory-like domain-containing protein [candidate division KSB1 bacterium]|nr:carboxypeptidase regulatory-like domain-containing protein [candidate division KSB1 bacterium]
MNKKSKIFFSLLLVGLLAVEVMAQDRDLIQRLAQDKGLIQGTVKSTDGQPITAATIIFKNSSPKFTTLADGRFVGKMHSGNYTAFVYKIGYKSLIKDNVEIRRDSTTNLEITLIPDPINQGYGSIAGRVIDQNDRPISGAKVIIAESFISTSVAIFSIDDLLPKGDKFETWSDGAGNFEFKKVPPGRYTAFALKDGYKSFMSFSSYVQSDKTKSIEIKLLEKKYSSIYGKIMSLDGEAIPAANIFLEGTNLGAASDGIGDFLIQDVPPGKYTLKVEMVGFETHKQLVIIEKNKDKKLFVGLNPELDFKLQRKADDQAYQDRLQDLRLAYFLAESASDREEILKQIRALLESIFDLKESEYANEIESKKRNIEALERLQKYRAANKNDIIERRLKELLTVY